MATIREGLPQEKLGNPYGIAEYSTFDLSQKHASTEPFGLLLPFEVRNAVTGDTHKLSNASIEKSYTLDAPLMSQVWKNKEWFMVPRMALLPNAWEKIYKQPAIGDDVDATEVGTSINAENWRTILGRVHNLLTEACNAVEDFVNEDIVDAQYLLTHLFRGLIVNEYFFSYGSLLNRLGASMASLYKNNYKYVYDEVFNKIVGTIASFGAFKIEWDGDGEIYTVEMVRDSAHKSTNTITMRECLQKMRDNLNFEIFSWAVNESGDFIRLDTQDQHDLEYLQIAFAVIHNAMTEIGIIATGEATYNYSKPMDLARLWAYQMICAEYYTDDKIDYIYNADLYREYISGIVKKMIETDYDTDEMYYTYNGIKIPYDWLSAHYTISMLMHITDINDEEAGEDAQHIGMDIVTAIFNINRSLKYRDYFTGGRTRPLATNDVIVSTAGNQFRVMDLSKRTQETRFKLAVNRIGNKIDEYVKGLLGVEQAVDYHYPLWIGKTTDVIRATETENTGAAQFDMPYAVSSRMEGYSNKYGFSARCDRDCILIGITYYDIERYYFRGVDRHFMHVDRFDMFNQFMQFTGDQPVYSEEYDAALTGAAETYFSYKPAYEEFKEPINRADSGFILSLKGFIFLDDVNEKNFFNKSQKTAQHISPDFIRSKPTELDRFYSNLGNNYSLGTYFHFISIYNNGNNAVRPMAYNPAINI